MAYFQLFTVQWVAATLLKLVEICGSLGIAAATKSTTAHGLSIFPSKDLFFDMSNAFRIVD
jgi:hypothetical protein